MSTDPAIDPRLERAWRVAEELALAETDAVDYAAELRAERDLFRHFSILLMAAVQQLTRRTRQQSEEIVRLRTTIRGAKGGQHER